MCSLKNFAWLSCFLLLANTNSEECCKKFGAQLFNSSDTVLSSCGLFHSQNKWLWHKLITMQMFISNITGYHDISSSLCIYCTNVALCEVIVTLFQWYQIIPMILSSKIEMNLINAKMECWNGKSGAYCFALKVVALQNPQAYCRGLSKAYISEAEKVSFVCL